MQRLFGVHRVGLVFLVFAFLGLTGQARAVTISFSATDLPDMNPGENLYRYDYSLDSFPFSSGFGFSVQFDPSLFASLESPPPVGSNWDIISLQPDLALPDDGIYDARALVSSPSQLTGFSVEFVWLGSGAPAAQPFVVYNASFATVESGQTVPVPEPGTLALLAVGFVGVHAHARRSTRAKRSKIAAGRLNRSALPSLIDFRRGDFFADRRS